jgi:hypothetical protein
LVDRFDKPGLLVVKAQNLPLSGKALLELMRAVLSQGRPFRFRARGGSMTPFIRDGDVITVVPLQQTLPETGEIVAFVRPPEGRLVVHRVVARQEQAVFIQGDNQCMNGFAYADGIIPQTNLLGKVTRIERNGKNVWLGLGPERRVIAWLSRTMLLTPLYNRLAFLLKLISWR